MIHARKTRLWYFRGSLFYLFFFLIFRLLFNLPGVTYSRELSQKWLRIVWTVEFTRTAHEHFEHTTRFEENYCLI